MGGVMTTIAIDRDARALVHEALRHELSAAGVLAPRWRGASEDWAKNHVRALIQDERRGIVARARALRSRAAPAWPIPAWARAVVRLLLVFMTGSAAFRAGPHRWPATGRRRRDRRTAG